MISNIIDESYFRHYLETIEALPTLPIISLKAIKLSLTPAISISEISKLIVLDPPLTATILKIANNSRSNHITRITSVKTALSSIDYSVLRSHLLSLPVLEQFSNQKKEYGIPFVDLWTHSINTAVWAQELAKLQKTLITPEEAFIAGLLHDIGKIIIADQLKGQYQEIISYAEENNIPSFKAEREKLGFDHADVGQWFLEHWDIPGMYCEIIKYHHSPTPQLLKEEKHYYLCRVINLADQLYYNAPIPVKLLNELGLSPENLEQLEDNVRAEEQKLLERIDWRPLTTSNYFPALSEANLALRDLHYNQKQEERQLIIKERDLQGINNLGRELIGFHSFQTALKQFNKMLLTTFPFTEAIATIYLDNDWELFSQAKKDRYNDQCHYVLAAQRRRPKTTAIPTKENGFNESWLFIDLIGKESPLGYLNVLPDNSDPLFGDKIGLILASCADIFSETIERIQIHQKSRNFAETLKRSVVQINEENTLTKQAKAETENIIESFPIGVLLLDEPGNIQYYNSMMAQLFPSISTGQGKSFMDLFPDPLLKKAKEAILAGENIFRGTSTLSSKETTAKKIYQWSLKPVIGNSESRTTLLFLLEDKTDEQSVQKKLLESARTTSVGELAAGTAHNLRNPLGAAKGILELLLEDIEEKNLQSGEEEISIDHFAESIKDQLQIVLKSLEKSFFVIDDLLHFASKPDRPLQMLNLNELLDGTETLLSELFKERDLEIEKNLEVDTIFGSQSDLTQVFLSLYSNAYKAMPQGGKLTVQSRLIALSGTHQLVKISISDTGCGIPEALLPKIFDPFYTTSERLEGTGLGLSFTKKIIQEHGGILEATSTVGKGTTFHITLPAHPETLSEEANAAKLTEELYEK